MYFELSSALITLVLKSLRRNHVTANNVYFAAILPV
jgi:hypothetical protein